MTTIFTRPIRVLALIGGVGAAGLLTALSAVPSVAEQPRGPRGPRGPEMAMERFDVDKDGSVTRTEATGRISDDVAKFDQNGNTSLSLEEFEGLWMERNRERMIRGFQRLDRDGDGQVTVEEASAPVDRMFKHLDKNDDGTVTAEEAKKGRKMGRGGRRHGRDHEDGCQDM